MKLILRVAFPSIAVVVLAAACSQHAPGPYEGGGRGEPIVIIGNTGSNCANIGDPCKSAFDCCSHNCNFEANSLVCVAPVPDAGGTVD